MTRKPLKFNVVREAYDMADTGGMGSVTVYVSCETGEIYWQGDYIDNEEPLPEDLDDTEKYFCMPDKYDLDLGKPLVLRFAREHMPDHFDKVYDIFSSRGAYARFKDLLEYQDKIQQWYDFEEAETNKALREWCELEGIELVD